MSSLMHARRTGRKPLALNMGQQQKLNDVFKYLPSGRQAASHFTILFALSCLIGPWIGPWLANWVNPPTVWGILTKVGDYSPMNVLLWGCALLMIEVFFYTGWLIALAKKGWEEAQPKSWYN